MTTSNKKIQINEIRTFSQPGYTYTYTHVMVLGNEYSIMQVIGNRNYVNIDKVSTNPFRMGGKDFANFTEAAKNYKSADMKTALLMAEINFAAL